MRGPKPPVNKHNAAAGAKVKNPMKTLKRLIGIIMKKYKFHMIFVFILKIPLILFHTISASTC